MIITAICNKHQSVGKTEITAAMAHGLTEKGYSVAVLCLDDDNQTNRMRNYCKSEQPRGWECYTMETLPDDASKKLDYVFLDVGRSITEEAHELMNDFAHYVIFPVGRDRKTFDEGVKPIKASLNGCQKAFVINEHVNSDGWDDSRIEETANGADIHMLYTWPDLQASSTIVKNGLSPRYSNHVTGVDRYKAEASRLADSVLLWTDFPEPKSSQKKIAKEKAA